MGILAQAVSLPETKWSLQLCLSDENPEDRISPKVSPVYLISLDCLFQKAPETSVRHRKGPRLSRT